MFNIGNLFDELYTDKTANLVLPNNNKSVTKLNQAIAAFDKNLDDILIQLNDISLFDSKLKHRAIEREQQKNLPIKEEPSAQTRKEETQLQLPSNDNNYGSENILDDINDFLSTVPDSADVNVNGDFNDNIQDLLMENNPYGDSSNDNNALNYDFQTNNVDNNGSDNNNNNNNNGMNNNGEEMNNLNMEFDNNIFDEIDSMLNI